MKYVKWSCDDTKKLDLSENAKLLHTSRQARFALFSGVAEALMKGNDSLDGEKYRKVTFPVVSCEEFNFVFDDHSIF